MTRDIDARLRAVSALHALCTRLPHVETPRERALLARFEALTTSPASVTSADADALAAGWRAWWSAGRASELAAMARSVPSTVIDADHRVATYAVAAMVSVAREDQR